MDNQIILIRKVLKMTQLEFARKLAISHSTLLKIEKLDSNSIPEDIINLICLEYPVNPEWLRTGTGYKGDLFLHFIMDETKHSTLKVNLLKILIKVDDTKLNNIFSDITYLMQINKSIKHIDEIEKNVSSYINELKSEKKGAIFLVLQNIKDIGNSSTNLMTNLL